MNGKFLLRLSALLVVFSFGLAAGNIDLFTGGVPSWGKVGDFIATTSYTGQAADSYGFGDVAPADANVNMLQVGGNWSGASGAVYGYSGIGGTAPSSPVIDGAVAGLLYTNINALIGDTAMGVASGSAIWKTVTVTEASTLDLQFNFVSNDTYNSDAGFFDDFAFFAAIQNGAFLGGQPQILARTNALAADLGVLGFGVGDWGTSGWVGFHYAVSAGTYTFVFGSVNVGAAPFDFTTAAADMTPLAEDSALLLDAVPEPGTWYMVTGAMLLLPAVLKRRKK